MHSRGLAFVMADVTQAVLEISPDCIATPISKNACRTYGRLLRSASRVFDCTRDWLQSSFVAWESGAYLEGPIWTRQETPALTTLISSFQGRLAVAALQCAFPGHYLNALAAPPDTKYASLFKLMCPPPSALRPTPARL